MTVASTDPVAQEKQRLRALIVELEKNLGQARKDLADIQAYERVRERVYGNQKHGPQPKPSPKPSHPPPKTAPGTVKEHLLDALQAAHPKGLQNGDIRHHAKEKYGVDLNTGSVSVMLMRLRDDDHAARNEGIVWFWVPPAEKKAA